MDAIDYLAEDVETRENYLEETEESYDMLVADGGEVLERDEQEGTGLGGVKVLLGGVSTSLGLAIYNGGSTEVVGSLSAETTGALIGVAGTGYCLNAVYDCLNEE